MITLQMITKSVPLVAKHLQDSTTFLEVMSRYCEILEHARHDFNLIGNKEVISEHIIDSLAPFHILLREIQLREISLRTTPHNTTSVPTIADLGTGAGMPGIPLAIALHCAGISHTFYLVERSTKKIQFLLKVIQSIHRDIPQSTLIPIAHTLKEWKNPPHIDIITSRAFRPLDTVIHDIKRIAPQATLCFYKGKKQRIQEEFDTWARPPSPLLSIDTIETLTHEKEKERHLVVAHWTSSSHHNSSR